MGKMINEIERANRIVFEAKQKLKTGTRIINQWDDADARVIFQILNGALDQIDEAVRLGAALERRLWNEESN